MEKIMSNDLKRGAVVFLILAVLTALEYIMAVSEVPYILLWLIALIKGGLVLWFFMHVFRVFGSKGGH
jgi:heme/copper-type cytochrome/quinol oxidase subunit 4